MPTDKLLPYEKIERFNVPFNNEQINVDYQAEYFEDKEGKRTLGTQRCRIEAINPRLHIWLRCYGEDRKKFPIRGEYHNDYPFIDPSALAVMLQKLPDYICNVLPTLDENSSFKDRD